MKTKIPANKPILDGNEKKYLLDCIKSGWISSGGKYTKLLEHKFAEYIGTKFALTCSSGTASLHLALLALGIGEGDEVIVPNLTIIADASMPILVGAKPVLVDVDEYGCLDPNKIKESINSKTKAILVVHLYGMPANMEAILKIAHKYKLFVIEDTCDAHGAEINGKKVGSFGDIGCFSFYSTKLVAAGEGGMVVTSNPTLAKRIDLLRDYGHHKPRFTHELLAMNYRMSELQCAVAYGQLETIEKRIKAKRKIAAIYQDLLKDIKEVRFIKGPGWGKSVFWSSCILIEKSFGKTASQVIKMLEKKNMECMPFFVPLNEQPVFKEGSLPSYPDVDNFYPESRDLANRGIQLPSSPDLTLSQQRFVIASLLNLPR